MICLADNCLHLTVITGSYKQTSGAFGLCQALYLDSFLTLFEKYKYLWKNIDLLSTRYWLASFSFTKKWCCHILNKVSKLNRLILGHVLRVAMVKYCIQYFLTIFQFSSYRFRGYCYYRITVNDTDQTVSGKR